MTSQPLPESPEREIQSLSPEQRRREARDLRGRIQRHMGPGTRGWEITKRTIVGTYNDGFIHAGNLAYLAMFSIFPFFILGSALFSLIGEESEHFTQCPVVHDQRGRGQGLR